MTERVNFIEANGRKVITTGDLVYCNTKWHKPYLAVVGPDGEFVWQDKEYSGYRKHRETYYVVEALRVGDLIQAAGGSGSNKYPFKGRVVEIDDLGMVVEKMTDREFGNAVAALKNGNPQSKLESLLAEKAKLEAALAEVVSKIEKIQKGDE